jgi:spermidine synthase
MSSSNRNLARWAAPLFVLSGTASLVYQVVWQRILALASGVGVVSVSVIVGAFMLGLGLGSEAGGRAARGLSPRGALRGFAVAEGFLAVFGAISVWLYYDVLFSRFTSLFGNLATAATLEILVLLPPTFAMGLSLPLLVRACVTDDATAAKTVTWLYGINVLGAAAGAFVTPWLLLRHGSVAQAAQVAAALNALVALAALALSRGVDATPVETAVEADAPGKTGDATIKLWIALYATSGFLALGLEMVWFRVVDVVLKSTAYTFGTVLGLYLLGIAIGTLGGRRDLRKSPLATFLALETLIGVWAIGSVLLLASAPAHWPLMSTLIESMKEYRGQLGPDADAATLRLYVLIPSFLFLVPTIAMGMAFPALQRAVQMSAAESPRRTGLLQAANILGSLVGSLVVGLLALEALGTAGTLRALGLIAAGFAILGWRRFGAGLFAVPTGLLVALVALVPDNTTFWQRLHGRADARSIVSEDASSVVALTRNARGAYRVSVNGFGHSRLPYAGIQTQLGVMPLVWHPAPRRIAIIGLGSGNTAWAALGRADVEHVVVYEIAPPQKPALEALRARGEFPALDDLLRDPRLELRMGDGRHGLATRDERFDAIEIDALYPFVAWSGNIYSREFFELCRDRLAAHGMLVAWAPTPRVLRTIEAVFPEVRIFPGEVVLASMTPLPAHSTLEALDGRFGGLIDDDFRQGVTVGRPAERKAGDVNRDLDPRDEFSRR